MQKIEYVVVFPIHGDGEDRQVLVHLKTTGPLGARGINGFGGKLEPGEDVEAALRRELDEEIDAEVVASGPLGRREFEDCVVHACWARITGTIACRGAATPESRLSLWLRRDDVAEVHNLVHRWANDALNYVYQALEVA